MTQVSDLVLWEQREILAARGPEWLRPGQDPATFAEFLHTEGYCAACAVAWSEASASELLSPADLAHLSALATGLADARTEASKHLEAEVSKSIAHFIAGLTLDVLRDLATDTYGATLGHRFFRLTNKRPGLIDAYLGAAQEALTEAARSHVQSNPAVRAAREAPAGSPTRGESLRQLLTRCGTVWLEERDLRAPDSTNPVLTTDTSVRIPVVRTTTEAFFVERRLDKDRLTALCDAKGQPPDLDTRRLIDATRARLHELVG